MRRRWRETTAEWERKTHFCEAEGAEEKVEDEKVKVGRQLGRFKKEGDDGSLVSPAALSAPTKGVGAWTSHHQMIRGGIITRLLG